LTHTIRILPETRLGRILAADEAPVNSMHHQAIKELAPGLRANAFAPDGLIEGVESDNGHFLVGVQWHPEELADRDAPQRRLFTAFLAEAEAYRNK
jgi:putative glutamine amidotransferase